MRITIILSSAFFATLAAGLVIPLEARQLESLQTREDASDFTLFRRGKSGNQKKLEDAEKRYNAKVEKKKATTAVLKKQKLEEEEKLKEQKVKDEEQKLVDKEKKEKEDAVQKKIDEAHAASVDAIKKTKNLPDPESTYTIEGSAKNNKQTITYTGQEVIDATQQGIFEYEKHQRNIADSDVKTFKNRVNQVSQTAGKAPTKPLPHLDPAQQGKLFEVKIKPGSPARGVIYKKGKSYALQGVVSHSQDKTKDDLGYKDHYEVTEKKPTGI